MVKELLAWRGMLTGLTGTIGLMPMAGTILIIGMAASLNNLAYY